MARPLIVDLDTLGTGRAPGDTPVRRYHARIAAAGTANLAGYAVDTAVACRRRPQGLQCDGHIVVRRQDVPEVIQWWCSECDDAGALRNWRHAQCALRPSRHDADELALPLAEHVYRTLEKVDFGLPAARVVLGAWYDGENVVLHGELDEMQALMRLTRLSLSGEEGRVRRRHLAHVVDVVRQGLASYRPG